MNERLGSPVFVADDYLYETREASTRYVPRGSTRRGRCSSALSKVRSIFVYPPFDICYARCGSCSR